MRAVLRYYNARHPLQKVAFWLWVAALLGVGGRVAFAKNPQSGSLLPIYLNAAHRWVAGEDLYAIQRPLDLYRNPPGVAAAFVPFTWVSERAANLLWRALGAAVFLVGLRAWVRHGLPRPLTPGETGAVFGLSAPLALVSLSNGQTNLVVIGAILLGATAAARARGWASGLWLGLATVVKVYPAAVGGLLAVAFPRRVLPWYAAGVMLLFAAPLVLGGWDYAVSQYRSLREATTEDDRTLALPYRAPRDLYLLFRVYSTPPAKETYHAITLGVAAGMLGLVFLTGWRTGDRRLTAAVSLHLGCVWMTVFGPATEAHTYTLLAPTAAAVLALSYSERKSRGWLPLVLAAGGYGLLLAPVLRDMFPNGWKFQYMGPHPAGGLLVFGAVLLDTAGRLLNRGSSLPGVGGLSANISLHAPGGVRTR
jgi:hypothetical protein